MEFPFGIREFFHSFLIYHYIFLATLFLATLFVLTLGIMLRKVPIVSILFYIVSFLGVTVAPFAGVYYIEEYLRGSSLDNIKVARLVYTPAIVITADLKNTGKSAIKKTNLVFSLVKKDNNGILEFVNIFKPARVQKVDFKYQLTPGNSRDIRVVLDTAGIANPSSYAIYYQIKSF
ncbi:MAG TPA: DUF2393 family protein [Campylobacterales bacterium]|nr:DUF2393 family protein [Campylobacterales bacterium]